jgi:hypothetical protein
MPFRKRLRIEPTEDWSQLQLHLAWPEKVGYELIRPVVLLGWPPTQRATQNRAGRGKLCPNLHSDRMRRIPLEHHLCGHGGSR